MPFLVESIKELGLVLVADTSDEILDKTRFGVSSGRLGDHDRDYEQSGAGVGVGVGVGVEVGLSAEWAYKMPEGVNGVMRRNGVLRFNDTIDM